MDLQQIFDHPLPTSNRLIGYHRERKAPLVERLLKEYIDGIRESDATVSIDFFHLSFDLAVHPQLIRYVLGCSNYL